MDITKLAVFLCQLFWLVNCILGDVAFDLTFNSTSISASEHTNIKENKTTNSNSSTLGGNSHENVNVTTVSKAKTEEQLVDGYGDEDDNQNNVIEMTSFHPEETTAHKNNTKTIQDLTAKINGLFVSVDFKRPLALLKPSDLKEIKLDLSAGNGITEDDLPDELENYVAPLYIRKNFPYYHAGYDDERRPIWITEVGKMDLRSLIEQGEEAKNELFIYSMQSAYKLLKSMRAMGQNEIVGILDSEGLQMRQLTYLPSIEFLAKLALAFRELTVKHNGGVYVINSNFLTTQVFNLAKPIFGPAMEKVELLGLNKRKWIPTIRRAFGARNLPPWYGGSRNFTPIAVYG